MARVPGTFTRRPADDAWQLVRNPATPHGRDLRPSCHDGSRFLTVVCGCGGTMHLHESQLGELPAFTTLATTCHSCGVELELNVGYVRRAIRAAWS